MYHQKEQFLLITILLASKVQISACEEGERNGYYDSLTNAYKQARQYLSLGFDGLVKLTEALQKFEEFVDATIDEECEPHTCPKGFMLQSNPAHIPSSNGCGSFGFEWKEEHLPTKFQKDCCNEHDLCYETCGADKDECDLKFKKCLYGLCKKDNVDLTELGLKACKGAAKVMYTGTIALGCKAYKIAQEAACHCVPPYPSKNEL